MGDTALAAEHATLSAAELFALPCVALADLIGARVSAECAGGARYEGLLHGVDPETHALFLLEGDISALEDRLLATAARVVMPHALLRLSVLRPASACEVPGFRQLHLRADGDAGVPAPPYDEAEAAKRRAAVAAALTKHHVPYAETSTGGFLVLSCLSLEWPFTADAASCPNARVLERVAPLLTAALEAQREERDSAAVS